MHPRTLAGPRPRVLLAPQVQHRQWKMPLEVPIALAMVAVAAVLLAMEALAVAARWAAVGPAIAADYNVVMDGTSRWLGGGPFYLPEQLDGPYTWPGPWMLYPPPMLLLFAPFTVLPAVLWWAIPLGTIAWVIARHRPRPLALGVIALCLVNPTSIATIYWGNPGLWIAAAIALATVYGWPAVLVLLKPTLLPFALIGIRRRSWWLAIGALVVVSFLFLPMWFEYIVVVGNARPPGSFNGLGYSSRNARCIYPAYWFALVPMALLDLEGFQQRSAGVHHADRELRPRNVPARHGASLDAGS